MARSRKKPARPINHRNRLKDFRRQKKNSETLKNITRDETTRTTS